MSVREDCGSGSAQLAVVDSNATLRVREHRCDSHGNLWARLSDGLGWVMCITADGVKYAELSEKSTVSECFCEQFPTFVWIFIQIFI